jgi:hypothetical protein
MHHCYSWKNISPTQKKTLHASATIPARASHTHELSMQQLLCLQEHCAQKSSPCIRTAVILARTSCIYKKTLHGRWWAHRDWNHQPLLTHQSSAQAFHKKLSMLVSHPNSMWDCSGSREILCSTHLPRELELFQRLVKLLLSCHRFCNP